MVCTEDQEQSKLVDTNIDTNFNDTVKLLKNEYLKPKMESSEHNYYEI